MSPFNLTCDRLAIGSHFSSRAEHAFHTFLEYVPNPEGEIATCGCTSIPIRYPACSVSAGLEVLATFWSQSGAPGLIS